VPFLPLGDSNPRLRIERPYGCYALIVACLFVFLIQIGLDHGAAARLVYGYGVIPAVLSGAAELAPQLEAIPAWATLISYQFLHGGWDHILGNLLFLWVFGDNVEDCLGHYRFLAFYLLCGVAAGLLHVAIDPDSTAPLIGASGAISGVLGAYLILHPFARLVILLGFLIPLVLPAWILLAGWFAFQFFASQADSGPVAWWAHIGGFVVGAALVPFFRQRGVPLFSRAPPRRIRLRMPATGRRARHAEASGPGGEREPFETGPWDSGPQEPGPWERGSGNDGPAERGPWDRDRS